jgi:hypothetical protein
VRRLGSDYQCLFEEARAKVIIDAFIFYNEIDLLHMRLEELYPVVDKFILVQAHHTFRGVPKEKSFRRDDPQWAPYIDKIYDITVGLSGGKDAWERERYQRNMISMELHLNARYAPNDIVMISDVDEIPRRETVEWFGKYPSYLPVQFEMPMYYYALNVRQKSWTGLKMLQVRHVTTAEEVRHSQFETIPDAGWHFSYLGDDEFISNKLRSFSHAELDTPLVHSKIADNRAALLDPYNHGEKLSVETVDDTWPHAVVENPDYWSKYVW